MALVHLELSSRYLGLFTCVHYIGLYVLFSSKQIWCQFLRFRTILILQAKCLETGDAVAIKKVLQDKRYKNRELQIMRLLDHPNVVQLKHCFFSTTEKDELYLNLVLEYISETVYRVSKHYVRMNQHIPMIYVQLYTYQVILNTICWFFLTSSIVGCEVIFLWVLNYIVFSSVDLPGIKLLAPRCWCVSSWY